MHRLSSGDKIPKLTGQALSGQEISLSDYSGAPLILSFYRYAGCQLCNLRMHDFIKKYKKSYEPAGINAIAVFQSPIDKMNKYTSEHDAPFEIISDPDYLWYDAFGLENSWAGLLKAMFKPKPFLRSVAKGYSRVDPDGSMNRLPADFLINEKGIIDVAFYSKDVSEHIPFKTISKWINQSAVKSKSNYKKTKRRELA